MYSSRTLISKFPFYVPREISFVDGRQGSRLSENGGDRSREGAALLATTIA
jgi:hypothetical protein